MQNLINNCTIFICTILFVIDTASASGIPNGNLKQHTIHLDSEYKIYHWTYIQKVNERVHDTRKDASSSKIKNYVRRTLNYEVNKHLWNGMYFAENPIRSQNYGKVYTPNSSFFLEKDDKDWVLVVLTLGPGTKVLDINKKYSLSEAEKAWFKERGCNARSSADINPPIYGKHDKDTSACANALMEYFDEADIVGLSRLWRKLLFNKCSAHQVPNYRGSTIVLKSSRVLNNASIEYLTASSHMKPDKRDALESVARLWNSSVKNHKNEKFTNKRQLWPIENSEDTTEFDLDQMLGCRLKIKH